MFKLKSAAIALVMSVGLCATAHGQVVEGSRSGLTLANSLYGPTGLIAIPTAYVVPKGNMAFSTAFGRDLRVPAGNAGILQYVEVGGAFIDREGQSNKLVGNAKIMIVPGNFKWFELGIGVIDAANAINRTVYFVASADIVPPKWDAPQQGLETVGLKVHLGAGSGLFQEKVFAGGELLFTKKLSLIGEWDTKNFNGAVRYSPTEYFRIQAGFQGKDIHLSATTTFKF